MRHLDYPFEIAPEFRRLAIKRRQFLFSHFLIFGRLLDLFDVFQSPNTFANGSEISQRATEPTLIYVKLSASQRRLLYRFLRLLLAADKQDFASASRDFLEKFRGASKLKNS